MEAFLASENQIILESEAKAAYAQAGYDTKRTPANTAKNNSKAALARNDLQIERVEEPDTETVWELISQKVQIITDPSAFPKIERHHLTAGKIV